MAQAQLGFQGLRHLCVAPVWVLFVRKLSPCASKSSTDSSNPSSFSKGKESFFPNALRKLPGKVLIILVCINNLPPKWRHKIQG